MRRLADSTLKRPPYSLVYAATAEVTLSRARDRFLCESVLLSFQSSNKGVPPWQRKPRRQRKRKQRRRSSFELFASQLQVRRMILAAGHIQPPFDCAVCVLNRKDISLALVAKREFLCRLVGSWPRQVVTLGLRRITGKVWFPEMAFRQQAQVGATGC